jgi:hypothetical protein
VQALRLHHRRRALQRDWCDTEQQLFDYSAATTLRGLPRRDDLGWGRAKRAIKQTAPVWNAVQRLRAAAGSLRKKPAAVQSHPNKAAIRARPSDVGMAPPAGAHPPRVTRSAHADA